MKPKATNPRERILSHHVAVRFNRRPDADEHAATAFQRLLDRSRPAPAAPSQR